MSVTTCKPGLYGLERMRYYQRQLITADDMTTEQEYFRQRDRRHNRFLHGWGVVCGLAVEAAPDAAHPWQVRVCPGYAVGPQGDEITVPEKVMFDLATGSSDQEPCKPWPCPPSTNSSAGRVPQPIYLAIRHAECDSRPVRTHPMGCGCDEMLCEYSRVRDDFELKVLQDLPDSHKKALEHDAKWTAELRDWAANRQHLPLPVPPCPACPDDPWVVIARIRLPTQATTPITQPQIDYVGRRVLYSVHSLQVMIMALP